MNTISGEHIGGGSVEKGVDLRNAIDDISSKQNNFINVYCMEGANLTSNDNECKKLRRNYKENGTLFYGIKASSMPNDLNKLREVKTVRLVDPIWNKDISEQFSKEYKVQNITTPLTPKP